MFISWAGWDARQFKIQTSILKIRDCKGDDLADLRPGGVVPRPEGIVPVARDDAVVESRFNEPIEHASRWHVAEMPFGGVEQRPAGGYDHYLRQLPPGH